MEMEEYRRSAIRVPELRKKELTTGLTFTEQRELESMMEMNSKAYPEMTEQQYAENVRFIAIRNYTFKDVTRHCERYRDNIYFSILRTRKKNR